MTAREAQIAVTSVFINTLVSKNLFAPLLTGLRYIEKASKPFSPDDIKGWATINGAKVPFGEGGVLLGGVGEKISLYSSKGIDTDDILVYNNSIVEGLPYKSLTAADVEVLEKRAAFYAKMMPPEYVSALKAYTDMGGEEINEMLMSGIKHSSELFECDSGVAEGVPKKSTFDYIVPRLDRAIRTHTINENMKVYRAGDAGYAIKNKPGEIINMKMYFSTSATIEANPYWNDGPSSVQRMEILLPKNSNAMYLGTPLSAHGNEKEILIGRNTNYKVLGYKDDRVILEVVL